LLTKELPVGRASKKEIFMLRNIISILFFTLITSLAIGQSNLTLADSNKNVRIKKDTSIHIKHRYGYPTPDEFTPLSLIDSLTLKNDQDTLVYPFLMKNYFPDGWVKYSDIDTLISLITSKKRCHCFADPGDVNNIIYLPSEDVTPDYKATIGGYAKIFINSFREKLKVDLGVYNCPGADSKSIEEILNWWAIYKLTK
jgi:hypothetical protein